MTRLDVCWLGRQPGLIVRSSKEIANKARWNPWRERAALYGVILLAVALFFAIAWEVMG